MSEPSLDFNSAPPATNDSTRKTLGGYLAGLIEGDGSIIVPKTIRNQKAPRTPCGAFFGGAGKFKFKIYIGFILVHSKNEIYRDRAKDEDNKNPGLVLRPMTRSLEKNRNF